MYWYADKNIVRDNNGGLMAICEDSGDALYLTLIHNQAIRQLTQREVTGEAITAMGAVSNLEGKCSPYDLGNEIHLQLGEDGYWYATTTVDTLGSDGFVSVDTADSTYRLKA